MSGARVDVVGIGELLWDCFGGSRRPGGAPANVAFHLGQLGLKAAISSRVGQDELGDELVQHLREHSLPTQCVQRDARHPTGTVTVNTDRADQPSYVIHENVAWDYLEFDDQLRALLETASAVCFGTLAQRSADTRRTIRQALETGRDLLRVYDVNLRPPFYAPEVLTASLRQSDVAKLNAEELPIVAAAVGLDAEGPLRQAGDLRKAFNLRVVCVTRGQDGCLLVSEAERADIPGKPVPVVDTVGAGDAFTAGLIYGLLADWPLERTARIANEAGALVASRPRAMPRVRDEYAALVSSQR